MTLTMTDLYERLKLRDEHELVELLQLTPEDIVEQFKDRIEELYEELTEEVEEDGFDNLERYDE